MKLYLNRIYEGHNYINGILTVDDAVFTTVEDGHNDIKIDGETCIPEGTYDIKLRDVDSPMNRRYKDRFGDSHKGMLWLQNVENFTYVYIHIGNSVKDTEGCILVGSTMEPGSGRVARSTEAYKKLYPIVAESIEEANRVQLTIKSTYTSM